MLSRRDLRPDGGAGRPSGGPVVATLVRAGRLVREHGEGEDRAERLQLRDALRAALDALRGAQLLVPGRDGSPLWAIGMGGQRVVWAFTDDEAYQAWQVRQPPELVAGSTVAMVGGGPGDLGALLQTVGAEHLAVNPAGPGWSRWPADTYRTGTGQGVLRKAVAPVDDPLVDPASRAPMRQAVHDALQQATAALARGDEAAFHTAVAVTRQMDDRHAEVTLADRLVRSGLDGPEPVGGQVKGLLQVAVWWGELGESASAAAALAEGGRRAVAALHAGDPNAWLRQAVAVVAGSLPRFGLPAWQADADAALDAAARYPRNPG